MYEIMTGVGVILFLATFVFPSQPITASFWMIGVLTIIMGSYAPHTVKAMTAIPFVILMVVGTVFIFGW